MTSRPTFGAVSVFGALTVFAPNTHAQAVSMGATVASDGVCPSTSVLAPGQGRQVYATDQGALCVGTVVVTVGTITSVGTLLGTSVVSGTISPTPYSYKHTTATGTSTLTGTVLHSVCINTKGATADTDTIYDGSVASGTIMAILDTTASVGCQLYDAIASTGTLTAVVATGTAADITTNFR